MSTKEIPPGTALVRTVASRELGDIAFDSAEVALDSVLTEGVLRELPVVGILVKLAKAGQSVAEELFLRKLLRFLLELRKVPVEERAKLLARHPDGTEEQSGLGENLLLALERLDNIHKPALLARFFAAYIREQVDYSTFSRLAQALQRLNFSLIPHVRWFYTREGPMMDITEDIEHELSLAGLLTVSLEGSGSVGGGAGYRYSPIGKLFLEIGYGVHVRQ
ncbi:MAG: hypothetical protein HY067_07800 [Betaproteobacteria bacterium]|nr:hypothetical protein [Betaproteobacteria bacterium]